MKQTEDYQEDDEDDGFVYEADLVKIAFCSECGGAVIVLGDEDHDVAVAHLNDAVLNQIIQDLTSIRYRLNN